MKTMTGINYKVGGRVKFEFFVDGDGDNDRETFKNELISKGIGFVEVTKDWEGKPLHCR